MTPQAHADERELVEFTMYAPMRDGVAESTMTGLFSDWRDIYIGVDLELATVAGTLLQARGAAPPGLQQL